MVPIFVVLTILVFLTIDWFVQRAEHRKAAMAAMPARQAGAAHMVMHPVLVPRPAPMEAVPAGVLLDQGHTWLQIDPSGAVKLGVDSMAVRLLGGLDKVEVARPGTAVRRGDPILTLRRGARQITMHSPVSGTVAGVNQEAAAQPSRVHRDPFGAGWLVRLTPSDLGASIRSMFVAEEAVAWMNRELQRLRDWLTAPAAAFAGATLQDGGLPADGLAERLDDEQWQSLARAFFEPPEDAIPPSGSPMIDPLSMD